MMNKKVVGSVAKILTLASMAVGGQFQILMKTALTLASMLLNSLLAKSQKPNSIPVPNLLLQPNLMST